jgi:AdoMet-dependent heme synthase
MNENNDKGFDFIFKDIQINLKTLFISLTNKCNLNCMHCAPESHSNQKHLQKKEDIINLVSQFRSMGGQTVSFSGGEPFTRKDLFELVEYSYKYGLKINIETNGLLLNTNILMSLKPMRKKIRFCLSLDGFSSFSHDWFRRKKGAFELVMKNLDLLESLGFSYSVSSVLHKRNINEIPEMVDYFIFKKEIQYRVVPHISKIGRGALEETRLIAMDNREVLDFLYTVYLPLYIKAKHKRLEKLMTIDLPKAILPKEINVFPACGFGFTIAGVNPEGNLAVCHRSKHGSALAINSSTIHKNFNLSHNWFGHKLFKTIRDIDESNLKGICSNCKFNEHCRGYCRISAFEVYKDIYAPYPVCQEMYEDGLFPLSSLNNKRKNCVYSNTAICTN